MEGFDLLFFAIGSFRLRLLKLSIDLVLGLELVENIGLEFGRAEVLAEFGVTKDGLVDNFRQGTESALARANFLRTTKLETLQAFVMYLVSVLVLATRPYHTVLMVLSLDPSLSCRDFASP